MNKYIYADNSSTTPLCDEAYIKMLPYLKYYYGNASTTYELGKISRKAIEESRGKIAKCINAKSEEIYFTSSGTESDNIAIQGVVQKYKKGHIITSKIEHLAVLNTCKKLEKLGYSVTYLNPDKNGLIDPKYLENAIRDDTILITIMYVNNEIGTIQDIYKMQEIAKKHNIVFHTDCVQAAPHIKIDASKIDMLSMSAHKFNGPKGVGVLYIKNGIKIESPLQGGHQESCIRPGTENVAGIVGTACALECTYNNLEKNNRKVSKLMKYLKYRILNEIDGVSINGDENRRIESNLNISIDGIDTNELKVFLDMQGICVSTGSACSSDSKEHSYVLEAIGQKNSALRITISHKNTIYEMDTIVCILKKSIDFIHKKEEKNIKKT